MRSVQNLLESLGPPPGNICLDWAWQLSELAPDKAAAEKRTSSLEEDGTPESALTKGRDGQSLPSTMQLTWREVAIDDRGRLQIQNSGDPQVSAGGYARTQQLHLCADELLRELLGWTEGTAKLERNSVEVRALLLEKSRQYAGPQRTTASSTKNTLARQAVSSNQSKANVRKARMVSGRKKSNVSGGLHALAQLRWKPLASLLIIGSLVLFALYLAGNIGLQRRSFDTNQRLAATEHNTSAASLALPSSQSAASASEADSALAVDELSILPESDETLVLDVVDMSGEAESRRDSAIDSATALDLLALDSARLGPRSHAAKEDSDQPVAQSAMLASPDPRNDVALGIEVEKEIQRGQKPEDVLSSVMAIAKQSEEAQTETAITSDSTDFASNSPAPPFILKTFPMLQVQRLSATSIPRSRQPAWKLRLAITDGFQIEPEAAIDISGKDVAVWRITEEAGEDPKSQVIQVMVQAQLLGNRGNAIRWRVAVVPQDLPEVFFPMGQQYLDLLQASLSHASMRLQVGIDNLKTLSRSSGLPSAARSSVSAQRKSYESQLQLVSRLREVAAQANQIDGWLDGQFEVHAQLIDLASPDSTPLLQFGDPEISAEDPANVE